MRCLALLFVVSFSWAVEFPVLNTVPELAEYWGYGCQDHWVTTDDGFILNMHRIVSGETGLPGGGEVVYLQHGLYGSSSRWASGPPDKVWHAV